LWALSLRWRRCASRTLREGHTRRVRGLWPRASDRSRVKQRIHPLTYRFTGHVTASRIGWFPACGVRVAVLSGSCWADGATGPAARCVCENHFSSLRGWGTWGCMGRGSEVLTGGKAESLVNLATAWFRDIQCCCVTRMLLSTRVPRGRNQTTEIEANEQAEAEKRKRVDTPQAERVDCFSATSRCSGLLSACDYNVPVPVSMCGWWAARNALRSS